MTFLGEIDFQLPDGKVGEIVLETDHKRRYVAFFVSGFALRQSTATMNSISEIGI
jgi:hypothetical protein